MDGKPREGHFKDAAGGWWKVELRHHPRKRFVIRPCEITSGAPRLIGTETPDLTLARWGELQDWLK